MEPIKHACAAVGGQSALAQAIGVAQPTVSEWLRGQRPVPIERCVSIERVTNGAVTRRDLRPADWWLIWPELVCAEHPGPAIEQATPTDRRESDRRIAPAVENLGAVELGAINAPIEYLAGERRKEVSDAA